MSRESGRQHIKLSKTPVTKTTQQESSLKDVKSFLNKSTQQEHQFSLSPQQPQQISVSSRSFVQQSSNKQTGNQQFNLIKQVMKNVNNMQSGKTNFGNLMISNQQQQQSNINGKSPNMLQFKVMQPHGQQPQQTQSRQTISPMRETSNNQRRRTEKMLNVAQQQQQQLINVPKEARIQLMKNEIKKNDMQIQQLLNLSSRESKPTSSQHMQQQIEDFKIFHGEILKVQSTGLPYQLQNQMLSAQKKAQISAIIKKFQLDQAPEDDEDIQLYSSPQFQIYAQSLAQNEEGVFDDDRREVLPQNPQGKQGESQTDSNQERNSYLKPASIIQKGNIQGDKSQPRPIHFSFGQISPKFYVDQPAANLLEQEDSQLHQKENLLVPKPEGKKKRMEKQFKEYEDLEDNEAQFIKRKSIRQFSKQSQGTLKQMKDFVNAEDIYGDKLLDEDIGSLNDSQGIKHVELGPNLRKIRVESFAKTPYFLKSPRSMASSQIEHEIDNDQFLSLNTYNGEHIDQELVQKHSLKQQLQQPHFSKMSQSSDEISKTVNIFFEKKSKILDTVPSQDFIMIHNYSPVMQYQLKNQQRLMNTNQLANNLQYMDQKSIQYAMANNNNQIPMMKQNKGDSKKAKFKIPKMKQQQFNYQVQQNQQQQSLVESFLAKQQQQQQLRSFDNRMQQQNLLKTSLQQVNPTTCEDKGLKQFAQVKDKDNQQVMRKNKQIFIQHQNQAT